MSKLSKEDVLKLARLARLRLTDAEVEKFRTEISAILGYVEMLQGVDTGGLEPTTQVTGLTNVTRADEIVNYGPGREELLKNAPSRENGYIKTKRILG
jgi:aspartyl-tRNA(Asn)/glutamyl-tRNA(Gln) amidotransferase subunit C